MMLCPHCQNDNTSKLGLFRWLCHVCSREFFVPETDVYRLTRHERHQIAADHGFDTKEDYDGDK